MVNEQYQKSKQVLQFSRKQVEKAGRAIRKNEGDLEQAKLVIQNFRAAHLYPLTIIKNLVWKHIRKTQLLDRAIIARRLKRLPTILNKLCRPTLDAQTENAISLKRMHDIGGCRVIVDDMQQLECLRASLQTSRSQHSMKVYDYIAHPKFTGYRGIHLVFKSFNNVESHQWKGFSVEVQLRTRLQHLWATTVEIVDIIEQENLKTDLLSANEQWRRLFFIMSEFLAMQDGAMELSIQEQADYRQELIDLNTSLAAYHKLDAFSRTLEVPVYKEIAEESGFTLLILDEVEQTVHCEFYSRAAEEQALRDYSQVERDNAKNAVLIAGRDLKSIEKAYPNYLSGSSAFLKEFSRIVLGAPN